MVNEPEMTSETFTGLVKKYGIALLFIQPDKVNQNAFVERFKRIFRDKFLDMNLCNSIVESQEAADVQIIDYNEFRPHEAIGNKTTMKFMTRKFKTGIYSFELSSGWGSLRRSMETDMEKTLERKSP